jgi:hypothetical protein
MAEDWLGNNVDKAQDKDRDKVRKISINGQKDKTKAERLEIRRATDRACERRVYTIQYASVLEFYSEIIKTRD